MKKYKLVVQDTFNKLELNKIYIIVDHWLYLNEDCYYNSIKHSYIDNWQLENMFKEVK